MTDQPEKQSKLRELAMTLRASEGLIKHAYDMGTEELRLTVAGAYQDMTSLAEAIAAEVERIDELLDGLRKAVNGRYDDCEELKDQADDLEDRLGRYINYLAKGESPDTSKRLAEIERRLGIDEYADRCGGCEREVPPNSTSCPHCMTQFAGAVGRTDPQQQEQGDD